METPDRVYTLPSTTDERKRLVAEIIDTYTAVFGKQPSADYIKNWSARSTPSLRYCHAGWMKAKAAIDRKRELAKKQEGLFEDEQKGVVSQ